MKYKQGDRIEIVGYGIGTVMSVEWLNGAWFYVVSLEYPHEGNMYVKA